MQLLGAISHGHRGRGKDKKKEGVGGGPLFNARLMGLPTVPMPGRRGAWNTCCGGGGKSSMGSGQTGGQQGDVDEDR
ncbi:hypothetical protein EYF80_044998 [Liparis tanakae]|uniref:Uncharacterized protein n=1 Tax=Liparis tanakae TaxID=230148 RepID=A0A4Z2FVI8_9TELE|nr:hypothetical protein EYF80_044998 [Liparis tanakae]